LYKREDKEKITWLKGGRKLHGFVGRWKNWKKKEEIMEMTRDIEEKGKGDGCIHICHFA
jgi:hypothetical protein